VQLKVKISDCQVSRIKNSCHTPEIARTSGVLAVSNETVSTARFAHAKNQVDRHQDPNRQAYEQWQEMSRLESHLEALLCMPSSTSIDIKIQIDGHTGSGRRYLA